jgi:hypothetical protein
MIRESTRDQEFGKTQSSPVHGLFNRVPSDRLREKGSRTATGIVVGQHIAGGGSANGGTSGQHFEESGFANAVTRQHPGSDATRAFRQIDRRP